MPGPFARTGLPQTTGPSALSPTVRKSSTAVIGIPRWYGARPKLRSAGDDGAERIGEGPPGRGRVSGHVAPPAADDVDGVFLAEPRHLLQAQPEEREHPTLRRDRCPVARDSARRDGVDEGGTVRLDAGPHGGQ